MAIVILVAGALLTLVGVAGYLYGVDILPTERGVAAVISSSVLFTGGILVLAVGMVLRTIEDLGRRLSGEAPPQATAAGPEPEAAVELPKVVAVEPARPEAGDRPAVPIEPPRPRPEKTLAQTPAPPAPVVAAPAARAGSQAARAGEEAVEKALALDLARPAAETPAPAAAPLPAASPPAAALAPRESVSASIDALTERLRAPLAAPKITPLPLPKIELKTQRPHPAAPAQAPEPDHAAGKATVETIEPPGEDAPRVVLPRVEPVAPVEPSAPPAAPEQDAPEPAAPASLADRSHEVEYPVEVLEAVAVDAPVVEKPSPAIDPMAALEAELGLPASEPPAPAPAPLSPVAAAEPPKAAPSPPKPAEPPQEAAPAPAPEPAPEPAPPIPSPGAEVVGAYESGGAKYTMYSDGSVVAEAGGETLYFKSLEELREFIDSGLKG